MAVFYWLGVTASDIKTYFSAMWFLKAHFHAISAAITYLFLGSPAHALNSLTRRSSSLQFCFPLHLNDLFLHEGEDDDNEDIGVQREATRTCNVKYSQVHSPG